MKYLRFFWTNTKIIKWTFLLVLFFLILESVSNYTLTFVQKMIIDDVFTKGHYSLLPLVIGIFATAAVIHSLMFTATSHYLVYNEFSITHSLLRRMLRRIERVPIEHFQNERHGKYVYTLTQDLFNIGSLLGWSVPRGLQELFNLGILMTIIGLTSPILLFLVVVMCTLYIAIGYYFTPRLKAAAKDVAERRTKLLIQIEEGVASTREVVAYNRMQWEDKLYNKLFEQFFDKVIMEGKLVNKQLIYSDPLKWGIGLIAIGYGGFQLMRGELSIGMFVVVFQFATQMSDSFFNLFQFVMGVSGQLAYIDRVNVMLDMEQHPEDTQKMEARVERIQIENIDFRYTPELPDVIRGFSGELAIGKKNAFVGTSGGGKSTIAQLLIRFYNPTQGTIRINGIPIHEVSREQWVNKMSIVFQDPYMFPDTIRENMMLGRTYLTEENLIEACRVAQIHDYIQSLPDGYDTNIGERGIKLSGGQRQRIAVARAILCDPEILVLDEATSALDLETERLLLTALEERRRGSTTIMIAHRLSTIENADIIFVMDQGALAETGTHLELIAKQGSVYRELLMAEG